MPRYTAVACVAALLLAQSAECLIIPTGLDDSGNPGTINPTSVSFPAFPEPPPEAPTGIFATFILQGAIPILSAYEVTIQFRLIQMINMPLYSVHAAFHPTALDHFASQSESNARRRDPNASNFEAHYDMTLAYAIWFSAESILPAILPLIKPIWTGDFGVDVEVCANPAFDCTDVNTPWGLAKTLVDETKFFADRDGWNADGSYDRAFNKIPYSDFREDPYVPVNDPNTLRKKKNWQPLLEHKGLGFLSAQQHVTPHVGHTGRSIFMGDQEHCMHHEPSPGYKYKDEVHVALANTAGLNDRKKAAVEAFDGKLTSIVPLLVQYYVRTKKNLDRWDFTLADSLIITTLYEAIMLVWREKTEHDAIRPPSIVSALLGDEQVTSYAGPGMGTQSLPADQWQPYIRTMPHAEYPSGSSCVCEAFASAMQTLLGTDNLAAALQGPLAFTVPAGSSKTEPGAVPARDETFLYSSWSVLSTECGQSRLDGGMHFPAAVPAGANLCRPIGVKVANAFKALEAGNVPSYVVDFFEADPQYHEELC